MQVVALRAVSSEFAERHTIVVHGEMHRGPLCENETNNAVPLVTKCFLCGVIITRGVPPEIVAQSVWQCECGTYNQYPPGEPEPETTDEKGQDAE
jgi:hypothetical protein